MKHRGTKILSLLLTLVLVLGLIPGMSLTAYADSNVASVTVGSTTAEYSTLSDALSAWTDGSTLTLLADVTTNSTINVSGTKTLDLNGYGILMTGNSGVMYAERGGKLTINDSAPTKAHAITLANYRGTAVADGTGTTSLTNGTGTAYITGGYITGGNTAWGSAIQNYGDLTINGGTVIGNVSDSSGAVRVNNGSALTLNGGQIIYNRVSTNTNGGAVNSERTVTINLSGNPVVKNNYDADGKERNVNLREDFTAIPIKVVAPLTDGAEIGITMRGAAGVFTNAASDKLTYNDATRFTSDDAIYVVGKNADGQLYLGTPITVIYKVVNGTWSDDSKGELTETVASGSKPAIVPTGMKASEGYTGGAWDTNPTDTTITGATTFTYTFTAIPTYTVTYKVVNGTWSDDSTTDKTETVQSGSKPASVPTGMKASQGFTGGAWD